MSISANFPTTRPSLLLDFADTRLLDPRITFTRASTATFYDQTSSALAEQNLVLQSQTFENSSWANVANISTTANTSTAPDGTTTADTITAAVGTAAHYIAQIFSTSANTFTYSVYAKAGTSNFLQLTFFTQTGYANFDLSTGVTGTTSGVTSSSITSVGSGWYRCVLTYVNSNATGLVVSIASSSSDTRLQSWTAAGTETILIWGAQVEQRSAVTAYTPTTTAAITNYIPVMQTAASGAARFDCNPVTRESLGLLIEEARTNLVTYSSAFDNAAWTKSATTVTAAADVAPDGTLTAGLLVATATTTNHFIYNGNLAADTSGTSYTYSIYVKAQTTTTCSLGLLDQGGSTTVASVFFNVSTGAVLSTIAGSGTITAVGNGWYRCTITGVGTGGIIIPYFYLTSGTVKNYTGDGYSGIYLWGAQLEAGAFATSYIPTVASQVTRAADAASMTGTNFSSWYGTSAGTVYSESNTITPTAQGQVTASIVGDNSANYILTGQYVSTVSRAGYIVTNATLQADLIFSALTGNTFNKFVMSFQTNNATGTINSQTVATDTSVVIPIANYLNIGNSANGNQNINGRIKRIAYYPVALTSTQLQALTS